LLVALPFRLFPDRAVYPLAQQKALGVPEQHAKGVSDSVFMTSRGGTRYDRMFMESFVRPGQDLRAWHSRESQPSNGVVPTGPGEMSFYLINHYPMPTEHLTRMVLRTDGFASTHAGYTPGTLLTKPLVFRGNRLQLNFATSAAGSLQVEILDGNGRVLATSEELAGDEIGRVVSWKGLPDVAWLAGRVVRLRFTLKDADLFALQFTP
jgi:hypothetical protein